MVFDPLTIKEFLKKTFVYEIVQTYRTRKSVAQWTEEDQRLLLFYSKFIQKGELCFDIGANMGNRVKVFLKLGARVVAVEPQPICVAFLMRAYGYSSSFTLIPKACGASDGEAIMMLSNDNRVSSLSLSWINAVKDSGRFSQMVWDTEFGVKLITLDQLINHYGIPVFIKIDVEGYEFPVIQGLSRRTGVISMEFTPEYLESAFRCIKFLCSLGEIQLNYSIGEIPKLVLETWISAEKIIQILSGMQRDTTLFGDIYVRFQD